MKRFYRLSLIAALGAVAACNSDDSSAPPPINVDAGPGSGTPDTGAPTGPGTGKDAGADASSADAGAPSTPDGGSGSPDGAALGDAAGLPGNGEGGPGNMDATMGADTSTGVDGGSTADTGADGGADAAVVIGGGPIPPGTLTATTLTGDACTISTPMVWTAAIYVVDCELEVDSVLTIDQGTIVKFTAGNDVTVSASGTINALGGSAYPIVFTSIKDDVGGDTNGDGNATSPAPGDWTGVRLNGTNNSKFAECQFEYTGGSSGALSDSSAAPVTVTNSIFAHNQPTDDSLDGPAALDLSQAPAGSVVTGNVFYDNRVPLAVNDTFSVNNSNAFDNSAAAPGSPQPNEFNGIVVNTEPNLVGTIAWSATAVPFVLTGAGGALDILSTGTLSLADGVIVKLGAGMRINVAGVLSSRATQGIVFTSIKDDAHGGDTNADGAATTPASGDWDGVNLQTSTGSSFNATGFYYGGGSDSAALEAGDSTVVVTNCTFGHDQTTTDAIIATPALDLFNAAGGSSATGNVFYDNRVPLGINVNLSVNDSNSFDNSAAAPGNPLPNEFNGIMINTEPDLVSTVSWTATKVPLVVNGQGGALDIDSTGTLTLGANTILKFYVGAQSGVTVSSGGAMSAGTGAIITSIRDDAHGGDTNGDGTATAPAAGDWWGIAGDGTSGRGDMSAPITCDSVGTEYYAVCPQ
jgi:hypothetical protein